MLVYELILRVAQPGEGRMSLWTGHKAVKGYGEFMGVLWLIVAYYIFRIYVCVYIYI